MDTTHHARRIVAMAVELDATLRALHIENTADLDSVEAWLRADGFRRDCRAIAKSTDHPDAAIFCGMVRQLIESVPRVELFRDHRGAWDVADPDGPARELHRQMWNFYCAINSLARLVGPDELASAPVVERSQQTIPIGELKDGIRRAYTSWIEAKAAGVDPDSGPNDLHYGYLKEYGCEVYDCHVKLPARGNWERYAREGRRLVEGAKNTPRAGRMVSDAG